VRNPSSISAGATNSSVRRNADPDVLEGRRYEQVEVGIRELNIGQLRKIDPDGNPGK